MFDQNPKDIEFAARQLANTHSHISYEQALEDMQQSADERQGDMQYAMLQAIGAVEVNDFIPDAIIYSPKEEIEQKPVEEMSLDELWPPVKQLASFMQKVNKTNSQLWANKEFPFHSAINGTSQLGWIEYAHIWEAQFKIQSRILTRCGANLSLLVSLKRQLTELFTLSRLNSIWNSESTSTSFQKIWQVEVGIYP